MKEQSNPEKVNLGCYRGEGTGGDGGVGGGAGEWGKKGGRDMQDHTQTASTQTAGGRLQGFYNSGRERRSLHSKQS